MATKPLDGAAEMSPERAWWLRVPAVLFSPRSVFYALREDDSDDVAARGEPILLLIWLAGIAAVLVDPTTADVLNQPGYDSAVLAVWIFIVGGVQGAAGYFAIGFGLFFGARLLGSLGDFRRERQIVAFAAAPLALSALILLPLQLALYGSDTFRAGGADQGAGDTVFRAVQVGFIAWSVALVLVGIRVVHGWSLLRSLATLGAAAGLLAAIVGLFLAV